MKLGNYHTTSDYKRYQKRGSTFFVWTKYWKSGFHVPIKPTSQFSSTKQILSSRSAHMIWQPFFSPEALSPTWSWRHGGCGAAGNSRSGELWHGHGRCHWALGGIKGDMGISGSPTMDTSKNKTSAKTLWWKAYGDQWRNEFGSHPDVSNKRWICHHRMYLFQTIMFKARCSNEDSILWYFLASQAIVNSFYICYICDNIHAYLYVIMYTVYINMCVCDPNLPWRFQHYCHFLLRFVSHQARIEPLIQQGKGWLFSSWGHVRFLEGGRSPRGWSSEGPEGTGIIWT